MTEIEELRQQVAILKEQLAAREVRISELLEVIKQAMDSGFVEARLAARALSRADDSEALREHEARLLEEMASKARINFKCDCGVPCDCFSAGSVIRYLEQEAAAKRMK